MILDVLIFCIHDQEKSLCLLPFLHQSGTRAALVLLCHPGTLSYAYIMFLLVQLKRISKFCCIFQLVLVYIFYFLLVHCNHINVCNVQCVTNQRAPDEVKITVKLSSLMEIRIMDYELCVRKYGFTGHTIHSTYPVLIYIHST
jgi:hypothetical protein